MATGHGAFAELNFSWERREKCGGLTSESFGGMRIEGEYDGVEAALVGKSGSFSEHGAVSAVNSVEVADSDETRQFFLSVQETIHSAYVINSAAKRKAWRLAKRIRRLCLDGPGDDW